MYRKITVTVLLLALLAFLGLGIAHFTFLTKLNQLSEQKKELESRQIILEELVEHLGNTRALFGSIPILVNTPIQKKEYIQTLEKHITNLKYILHILKTGGSYQTTLLLNLPSLQRFEQRIQILRFSSREIAPLNASINQIETYAHNIETLLTHMLQVNYFKKDLKEISAFRTRLTIAAKKQDAFFRRTFENLNHLFYRNRTQLNQANLELDQNESHFRYITFSMSLLLLLIVAGTSLVTIQRILRLNKTLHEKLYRDELTGTRSRLALEDENFGKYSVVYMVDIDDFSGSNSLYGTLVGDKLLRGVSRRLLNNCGSCKIHRFGGDVFALMAYDLRQTDLSIKKRIAFVEDLIEGKAFTIDKEKIHIGVTIGVGVGTNAIAQAMLALDIAKAEKKPYKIYSRRNRYTRELKEQRKWKRLVTLAIKEDRVLPFIQPIVDQHGHIIHHECLMRIAEPTGDETTYLAPVFLEAAKKAKLYPRLSRLVIQKSFEKFRHGGSFSINLSYLDIKENGTKFFLEELIDRYHAHGRVMFEILEHESLDDFKFVEDFLDHFRERGVQIAIDDFGSEYSNLMEIIRIRPDYLKIDGSLIRNIASKHNAYLAVRSITEFARDLGMKTIAEFVYDHETFLTCREIGVDYFQGYYFSPAVRTLEDIPLHADGSIQTDNHCNT